VYVLDWGVARVIVDPVDDEDEPAPLAAKDIATFDETKTGALLGTPGYMAPEQLRGIRPTPAADVYALGAILFEILAAEPLHPRGEAAVGATLAKPTQSPSTRKPDVPPELDALCAAALAEDPGERPTAHDLADGARRARGHGR
jgi:serine/threonine-protein kinase